MPLIPSKLNFLPSFDGRESLYSCILPGERGNKLTIRILTVIPSHDYFAPIEASLSIETLKGQDTDYNAVSYYWGDINELENIVIHGSDEGVPGLVCEVPVTKNLTAALRQFRATAFANKEPLRLWIDALCINQTDAAERKSQVLSMKRVFAQATSVWIWLGESNELVEAGLATLVDQTNSYVLHRRTGSDLPSAHFMSTTLSLDEEVLYIKQFAAIDALPYWRRGWTFQENMQSRKHICYGELKIELRSWRSIKAVFTLYALKIMQKSVSISYQAGILPLLSIAEREFLNGKARVVATFAPFAFAEEIYAMSMAVEERVRQLSDAEKESGVTVSANSDLTSDDLHQAHFLRNTFYRTSDPRDSVFALREIIPGLANVELNYASTPEHVFSVATIAFLRNAHDGLRELHQWFRPQASPHLPSWVFDFTHCNSVLDENGHNSFVRGDAISMSDASAGAPFCVAACDGKSIHVDGFVFDEILDISCSIDRTVEPSSRWLHQLNSWVRLALLHFSPLIPRSKSAMGTFTRSFIRTFGSDCRPPNRSNLSELNLLELAEWSDGLVKVLNAIMIRVSMVEHGLNYEESGEALKFMKTVCDNAHNARFFVTKSLKIGLAPIGAAIGDRIAILASGNIPLVLRPVPIDYAGQGAYRIIGGCFVDGSMHGEAVYSEAARLCKKGQVKLFSRTAFKLHRPMSSSSAGRERCRKAAVELAFASRICLV